MANCQACGTEMLGQERFCRNCGAPVSASVEDLADTRRFDPSAPVLTTGHTGSLDPSSPFFAAAPTAYPLAPGSAPLDQATSFIKSLLQRRVVWVAVFVVFFVFIGGGITIGRDALRARRAQRAERAKQVEQTRQVRQAKQAEVARRSFEETIQNALGFTPAVVSDPEYADIQGIFVASLTSDDSPAALAHVEAGDVLTELNDQAVRNNGELAQVLSSLKPGTEVAAKMYRDPKIVASRIKLASASSAPFHPKVEPRDQGFLGVGDVSRRSVPGLRTWGLEIHRIIDNSPADLAGLQLGDIITGVDEHAVRTPQELSRRIHSAKPRSKVKVKFHRGSAEQTTELIVGHGW